MLRTFLGFAVLAATSCPLLAQDMLGVHFSGDLYQIDSATGAGTLFSTSGAVSPNAMAKRSDGRIFVAGDVASPPLPIYEIDIATGLATQVATVPLQDIRGLAFDPSDTLYAVHDRSTTTFDFDDLYILDLAAGTATLIGSTNYKGVQALAWGNDTLWGWECGSGSGTGVGLIRIDPGTGTVTDVNPSVGGTCAEVQSLAFGPTGVLYGIRDELYTVDMSSGVLTLVGSGGYTDIYGVEFSPTGGPTYYCTAKTTSIPGCVPSIHGPAATASLGAGSGSYDVTCGPVPGHLNIGVLAYTTNGPLTPPIQSVFGYECISTGPGYFVVTPVVGSGGTAGTCSGSFTFDFGAYLAGPHGNPSLVAGATVDMQAFYRDPLNTGGANLSDALAFALVP